MAEEMVLKFRRAAETLYSDNKGIRDIIRKPLIIAMKGNPSTGRKLAAFGISSVLQCPLIKEDDFNYHEEKTAETHARLWGEIHNLARSQLTSGCSIVIDSELTDFYEFDRLRELSDLTNTHLAVLECRVNNVETLWAEHGIYDMDNISFIATEFMDKPTSFLLQENQNIHSITNYNLGKIPRILVEVNHFSTFGYSVTNALNDFVAHVDPKLKSEQTNCDHVFDFFINIDNKYKRRCCQCSQLVSGCVISCSNCRFFTHATCDRFPESLLLGRNMIYEINLKLENVGPELDDDASCTCCEQLLRDSVRTQYYSTDLRKHFFDLDCLFLLPAERKTKLHEHELRRAIDTDNERWCNECGDFIDKNTIFYFCRICRISMDVYCLWLPETVEFEHHKHSFTLSKIPRVDLDPYYCDVCEKERDTDRWMYYCADCDFPVHPRCIVASPRLPRFLRTEISTKNKNVKNQVIKTKVRRPPWFTESDNTVYR